MPNVILQSELTCPECGHKKLETMPTDACQWYYECEQCHVLLKPKAGDCCVYCSYGSVPCPSIQFKSKNRGESGCCGS
ncbi:GDCCVxC domain-containing (seleno)protein [Porticoccus sp.]